MAVWRFFLQITSVSCLLFAGLILWVQAVGQMQPTSPVVDQLHLLYCDLPCWIGIVPGETPFTAAVMRTAEIDLLPTFEFVTRTYETGTLITGADGKPTWAFGLGAFSEVTVGQISLSTPRADRLRVGDVLLRLSKFSCPIQRRYNRQLVYASPTISVYLTADRATGFPLERLVTNITIQAQSNYGACQRR